MTYKFLWDMKTGYASAAISDARSSQEIFVRLTKFLDNASSLGVSRVASCFGLNQSGSANFGSTPAIALNGQGLGYWDDQNQAGANAFAVYRFGNATVPFYVLLQWTLFTNATFAMGAAPGAPASHPDGSWAGVGIQFAARSDGSNPWGGTTNNNGFDTKTTPVWTTGSNGLVWVWPRTNSPGGSLYSTTRGHLMGVTNNSLTDGTTNVRWKMTVAMDENNLFIATDDRGQFNQNVIFFGKYIPISGSNPLVPYWGFQDNGDPPFATNTIFGTVAAVAGTAYRDGGIGLLSATLSGTVGILSYDVPDPGVFFAGDNYRYHPDTALSGTNLTGSVANALNAGVGVVLQRPILLYNNDASNALPAFCNGLIGYSYDFLRIVANAIQPNMTLSGGTRLVIGNNTPNAVGSKWVIPWTGSMGPMYVAHNRNGVEF